MLAVRSRVRGVRVGVQVLHSGTKLISQYFTNGSHALCSLYFCYSTHSYAGTRAIVNRRRLSVLLHNLAYDRSLSLSLTYSEYAGLRRIRTRLQYITTYHCAYFRSSLFLLCRHFYYRTPVEKAISLTSISTHSLRIMEECTFKPDIKYKLIQAVHTEKRDSTHHR